MLLLKELRNCILRTIFVWSLFYWIWAYTSLHFLSALLGNYFFLSFCAFCVYCQFWFRRTLYSLNKKHASRELLSFNNFIYKENCGTFRKWQSVKETLSANDFFLGNLRSKSFILKLCYQHHRNIIVETTDTKYGLLPEHLFERTQQHGSCTKPQGNNLFV